MLFAGIACLDVVIPVDKYPVEDSKMRTAGGVQRQSGGNASNSAVIAAQLQRALCALGTGAGAAAASASSSSAASTSAPYAVCVLSNAPDWRTCSDTAWVRQQLAAQGVEWLPGLHSPPATAATALPVSYVLLNKANGSRTILHHRGIPELSAADLLAHVLPPAATSADATSASQSRSQCRSQWRWVHFEGRGMEAVNEAITTMRRDADAISRCGLISLEVERWRESGAEALLAAVDVAFVSADYVRQTEPICTSPTQGLDRLEGKLGPHAWLVLPWGSDGAYASVPASADGSSGSSSSGGARRRRRLHVPAHTPPALRNTLAAGDTFIGAFLTALMRVPQDQLRAVFGRSADTAASASASALAAASAPLQPAELALKALTFAALVAGEKCGIEDGLDLSSVMPTIAAHAVL